MPASGTEIIEQLGAAHMESGRPILYTSADSVFQIAAHEEVVPRELLYEWSARAREMLRPPHNVNRVIARPFLGRPGAFWRTPNRRDYAIEPPPNLLDELRAGDIEVHAVGKISDIYCGRAIATSTRAAGNREAMEKTFELLEQVDHGFIFTNLNDFDSKYGHRRDVRGYGNALEELDTLIPRSREPPAAAGRANPYRRPRLRSDRSRLRSHARVRSVLASRARARDGCSERSRVSTSSARP